MNRREVLCHGCALLAMSACSSGSTVPLGSDTSDTAADSDTDTDNPQVQWPCLDETPGSDWLSFDLPAELAEVGGAALIQLDGVTMNVAHVFEGCFVAMPNRCTHQGAVVEYRPNRGQFVCTLHGAIYDLEGGVVAGPAPQNLPVHAAAVVDGTLFVDPTPRSA